MAGTTARWRHRSTAWLAATAVVAGLFGTAAGAGPAAAADTTGPVLNAISISPRTVHPGETAAFAYDAASSEPLTKVVVEYDAWPVTYRFETPAAATVPASGTIDVSMPPGSRNRSFPIKTVTLSDALGRSATWTASGTISYAGGASGPATHAVPFLPASFTTADYTPDTTTPTLVSVSRATPAAVTVGEPIEVAYSASDESELYSVTVRYEAASAAQQLTFAATQRDLPKTGTLTRAVEPTWANGAHRATSVVVRDRFGLTTTYSRDGSVTGSSSIPRPHTFDLSALDFTVSGSPADFTPPVLTSVGNPTSPVAPAGRVSLPYATRELTGPLTVSAKFTGINGQWRSFTLAQSGLPLTGTLTGTAGTDTQVGARGSYALESVAVEDARGNHAVYKADGTVVSSSPAGPTSHTLSMRRTVVLADKPEPVGYVRAVPGDRSATVTWEAYGDNGGAPVTRVVVTASPSGKVLTSSRTSGSVTFTGLSNLTSYTFSVRADNGVGLSAPVSRTALPRPRGPRLLAPGDYNKDGRMDVLGVKASTGEVIVYNGNGKGGFSGAGRVIGRGWGQQRIVLPTQGPLEEGQAPDLWSVHYDGTLAESGSQNGTISYTVQRGAGWGMYRSVFTPGDWTGDGLADVMGIDDAGGLYLYKYRLDNAMFQPRVKVGAGWQNFRHVFAAGDQNGDWKSDLVGVRTDGTLWLYTGNGKGGFSAAGRKIGSGWGGARAVFMTDFTGDHRPDILSVDAEGAMRLYQGNGRAGFTSKGVIGRGWQMFL